MARFLNRLMIVLIVLAVAGAAAYIGRGFLATATTIHELLTENRNLKAAIANLTAESQIGYAKVLEQTDEGGRKVTRLIFVETDRDDPSRHILEKEYTIEGDVVYFDALIVRFSNSYVADGKARALYLWNRVYGEMQAPSAGFPIEEKGTEPQRYTGIFAKLHPKDRELFWSEIWKLSDDEERLRSSGIDAVYGNVVYKKLRPGFIYVFKITNTGQVTPETVPDLVVSGNGGK